MTREEATKAHNVLRGMGYTGVNIGYTSLFGYVVTGIAPSGSIHVFGGNAIYEWCLEHPEQKRLRELPEPLANSSN